ncbi:nucleoid-associated protein [Aureitalea marina]|uniref:Nucleoid-associated protein NdpA n=1 Tax=Aureitalea marina TaxID=930804 RepID=A0A2S7KQ30_9FLAO|nr:nucleoid-associated protein [Aureitalea marina]PQB04736.1 nucleoid-associated protein NdpA [Aureitalea marina]
MINLYSTQIDQLSIHRVGNKSRAEGLFLSATPCQMNDELHALLKEYFFKPFREKDEDYLRFAHEVDLEFHTLQQLVKRAFAKQENFTNIAQDITRCLYEQSDHPHIKGGEVYVTYLEGIVHDNEKVDGIGIFKSELTQDFLQFDQGETQLVPRLEQGINLSKLDKGALILNVDGEDGFKLLSVDSNRYDTRYWLERFLGAEPLADENFKTKHYLKMCQDFARQVVLPAEDKKEEVLFMNRAVNHFAKNDTFEETQFMNDVIENPDLIPEFRHFKTEQAPKYKIEDLTTFPIANTAVTAARKKIRNTIELDTNIQIKMDFINPESAERFVEKGWDEEKQMYYYLVYFNQERKS